MLLRYLNEMARLRGCAAADAGALKLASSRAASSSKCHETNIARRVDFSHCEPIHFGTTRVSPVANARSSSNLCWGEVMAGLFAALLMRASEKQFSNGYRQDYPAYCLTPQDGFHCQIQTSVDP